MCATKSAIGNCTFSPLRSGAYRPWRPLALRPPRRVVWEATRRLMCRSCCAAGAPHFESPSCRNGLVARLTARAPAQRQAHKLGGGEAACAAGGEVQRHRPGGACGAARHVGHHTARAHHSSPRRCQWPSVWPARPSSGRTRSTRRVASAAPAAAVRFGPCVVAERCAWLSPTGLRPQLHAEGVLRRRDCAYRG